MWSTVAALGLLIALLVGIGLALKKYGNYRADKQELKVVEKYKRLSNEEKTELIKSINSIYGGDFNSVLGMHKQPKEDVWGGDARIRNRSKSSKDTGETR